MWVRYFLKVVIDYFLGIGFNLLFLNLFGNKVVSFVDMVLGFLLVVFVCIGLKFMN